MPQVTAAKPAAPRKRVTAGLVVAVAVVAGAAVGWAAWYFLTAPSATTVAAQAQALDDQHNYPAALKKLEAANRRPMSASDKVLIVSGLATTYQDMSKNDLALQYLQQEDKLRPHQFQTLIAIGELAERIGKKDVALDAYQQALVLRKADAKGMYAQSDIDSLNIRIAELQK